MGRIVVDSRRTCARVLVCAFVPHLTPSLPSRGRVLRGRYDEESSARELHDSAPPALRLQSLTYVNARYRQNLTASRADQPAAGAETASAMGGDRERGELAALEAFLSRWIADDKSLKGPDARSLKVRVEA